MSKKLKKEEPFVYTSYGSGLLKQDLMILQRFAGNVGYVIITHHIST